MISGKSALLGLVFAFLLPVAAACSGAEKDSFPSYAYASSLSLESYRAAANLPSVLTSWAGSQPVFAFGFSEALQLAYGRPDVGGRVLSTL